MQPFLVDRCRRVLAQERGNIPPLVCTHVDPHTGPLCHPAETAFISSKNILGLLNELRQPRAPIEPALADKSR